MLGKKEGLFTKQEIQTLWKVGKGEIPLPGWLKPFLGIALPGLIDGLDNKVGDRIPEPWQSHCENLVTYTVDAVEDKVVTEEEVDKIMEYAAVVVDERIDIPMLGDDAEALMFLEGFRMLGAGLYAALSKKKVEIAISKGKDTDSGEPDGPDMHG